MLPRQIVNLGSAGKRRGLGEKNGFCGKGLGHARQGKSGRRGKGSVPPAGRCVASRHITVQACVVETRRETQPKMIWEPPPGALRTREDGRSVMKLPTFWPSGRA